jgi:hypothetical protein
MGQTIPKQFRKSRLLRYPWKNKEKYV